MRDYRDAKAMARSLRDALSAKALPTTYSESLELIAKAFGYDNWNILSAKIEAAKPSPVAAGAIPSAGTADLGSPKTLYCSFCGKSQHDVRKLIAGPLVYICDECVQLCTDVVKDEDTSWKVFNLLAVENNGDDGRAAALEHRRGRPTGSPKTLYCSFCDKSEHDVRKLIAGPLVYICDECVQLCTDVVKDEDTLWKVFSLLAVENNGDAVRAAALEHLRGRPTDDLASFVERSKQFAERNHLIVQSIRRKLVPPRGEDLQEDDVLFTLPNSAYLKHRSREELVVLQQGAERAVKRADDAMRLGMRVLDERKR